MLRFLEHNNVRVLKVGKEDK